MILSADLNLIEENKNDYQQKSKRSSARYE